MQDTSMPQQGSPQRSKTAAAASSSASARAAEIAAHVSQAAPENTSEAATRHTATAARETASQPAAASNNAVEPEPQAAAPNNAPALSKKTVIPLLVVLYVGAFLAGFSENLMNMTLVAVMDEFAIDSVTAQWLVTAYMIVATVMVTLTAFLYRTIKLRTLFFSACGLFFLGSLAGFFAPNFFLLLAARVLQAIGSGVLIPTMMNTILVVAPKDKLGSYMSIGGCMITFGPALAPVACGGVVTAMGWHYVFLITLVGCALLLISGAVFLKNFQNQKSSLDIPSALMSAIFLASLSLGLAEITTNTLVGIAALVLAIAALALFVQCQFHCAYPLIDLTPMKSRTFWPATILVLIAMMSTFSSTVLLPLYLETGMGLTAAAAGLVILVPVLFNAFASLLSGRILDAKGEWPLLPLGFAFITIGFIVLSVTSASLTLVAVFAGALFVFIGVGMTLTTGQTAGLRTLPPELNPFGVALMSTFVQIAACVGPPLFTGLLASGQANALASGAAETIAVAQGFSLAVSIAAVCAFVAFVCAFVYSRYVTKLREQR